VEERQVMFGCLDTWLLWLLTGRTVYATDYSNASATMLYDPFQVGSDLYLIFTLRFVYVQVKN